MRGFCRKAMINLGVWKYENGCLYCSLLPCLCGTIVLNCNFCVEGILHFFPHPDGEIYCCNEVSSSKKLNRSSWSGDSRIGSFKLLDGADYNFWWSQEGPYNIFFFFLLSTEVLSVCFKINKCEITEAASPLPCCCARTLCSERLKMGVYSCKFRISILPFQPKCSYISLAKGTKSILHRFIRIPYIRGRWQRVWQIYLLVTEHFESYFESTLNYVQGEQEAACIHGSCLSIHMK